MLFKNKISKFSLVCFLNLFLLGIIFSHFYCKNKESINPENVKINSVYDSNTKKLEVNLIIPKNLHAYLNEGDEKNLIPVTFDFTNLVQKNILLSTPPLLDSPKGERSDKEGATVLRDSGKFIFNFENLVKNKNPINQEFKLRLQICDEVAGICYKPNWTVVYINKKS